MGGYVSVRLHTVTVVPFIYMVVVIFVMSPWVFNSYCFKTFAFVVQFRLISILTVCLATLRLYSPSLEDLLMEGVS